MPVRVQADTDYHHHQFTIHTHGVLTDTNNEQHLLQPVTTAVTTGTTDQLLYIPVRWQQSPPEATAGTLHYTILLHDQHGMQLSQQQREIPVRRSATADRGNLDNRTSINRAHRTHADNSGSVCARCTVITNRCANRYACWTAARCRRLDPIPHGCAEQTLSRLLPLIALQHMPSRVLPRELTSSMI